MWKGSKWQQAFGRYFRISKVIRYLLMKILNSNLSQQHINAGIRKSKSNNPEITRIFDFHEQQKKHNNTLHKVWYVILKYCVCVRDESS